MALTLGEHRDICIRVYTARAAAAALMQINRCRTFIHFRGCVKQKQIDRLSTFNLPAGNQGLYASNTNVAADAGESVALMSLVPNTRVRAQYSDQSKEIEGGDIVGRRHFSVRKV